MNKVAKMLQNITTDNKVTAGILKGLEGLSARLAANAHRPTPNTNFFNQ